MASEAMVLDDRYEVGAVLGRGGMGEVRRAHDRRLARDVAVKFLRADLAAQPDVRNRFASEATNAARLHHPNVVLVLDTGEHAGVPYLVMECLPGPTLRDEMNRGPMSGERASAVAADVLGGLVAAHDLGIVHRDISPANILLTEDGRAKIADFGIAKSTEGLDVTVVGQVLGTPAYLSPERLRGEPATPSADVYALGVVLYEALTGEKPFAGSTPVAVATAVMSTTPEPLAVRRPDLDRNLTAAVDGAMVKDPTQRVSSAAAMLAQLDGGHATEAMATATTAMPISTTATPISTTATPVVGPNRPPSQGRPSITESIAARWARLRSSPRDMWITIAIVVVIGALLLGLTTHKNSNTANSNANHPTTTIVVPTTVTTTPVTVAPVVVAPGSGPKKGHGKHG